jgi:pyruvate dehydrogenase E2 component (dihydrolipoamide acetyltransferase)
MASVEINVPDIGDVKDVAVIELLVNVGDTVQIGQSLVTVESDKASMELPSPQGGVVSALRVALGDKVSMGSPLILLESAADQAPPLPSPSSHEFAPTKAAASPAPAAKSAPAPTKATTDSGALSTSKQELRVPDIGDFKDVAVTEVFIKAGDTLRVDQSVATVESDKASMEIPATLAGVVVEVKVAVGQKINTGSVLAIVESSSVAAAPSLDLPERTSPTAVIETLPLPVLEELPKQIEAVRAGTIAHASPSVRKKARELGVPLQEVVGTGPRGRVTQADVELFVRSVMRGELQTREQSQHRGATPAAAGSSGLPGLLPWPVVDFAKFGPIERKDLSRIKKIAAANLHRNWVMIPHVTNNDDADISELENFRVAINKENEKSGVKLTLLAFLIKASVAALKKFPEFNASLDGEQLVYKNYYHIGFAVDTPNGLVVPVLRDADQKGVLQIAKEMSELAAKARDGKLSITDMSGGTFSISSLGGIGGTTFTPIINAPEVAILGVCKSFMKPVWDGKAFVPRLTLPLSLSWDHRVLDGAGAARFNAYLGQVLADFRRVLL